MIYDPERDQFFTQSEGKEQMYTFQCAATGNPVPLISWFRIEKDGSEVDLSVNNGVPYKLNVFGGNLEGGRNVYICRASNRQAVVNRTVNIVITFGNIETDAIEETNDQVNNQVTLNGDQATNIASLVDYVIQKVRVETVYKFNTTGYNGTNKSDENVAITSASQLFRNVIDRWDGNTRRENNTETNEDLFNTNSGLIQSTQNLQNGTTDITEQQVSYNICLLNNFNAAFF